MDDFSLKNKVNEVIDDFVKSGGSKIVFTGHSLGACITISCLENSLKYPDIDICCITFGSPKIGDKAFVDTFDNVVKHSYRVVDEEDIITNFPIGFGYFHVKNEVTLKGQNTFSWYRFGLNLMRYVWEGRIFAHSLFNYLSKIDGSTV